MNLIVLQTVRGAARSCLRWPFTLVLLCCIGCSERGPQDWLENYQQRLARALDVTLPPPASPAQLPQRPRSTRLQIDIDSGKLDTLDFLALSGCEVQVTIGKANSSLGRLARPSQRLLLALEFLQLAPPCIAWMEQQGNTELAGLLRQAQSMKQRQLAALVFNATLGSSEYRDFWKPSSASATYPAQTSSVVIHALSAINADVSRWLAGDFAADGAQFELHLSDIARGDGGALLAALDLQRRELARAGDILLQRQARGPLCTPAHRPPAAAIADTVVRKFLIGEVQPWSAALGSRYHALLPPVASLESLLEHVLPADYRDWRAHRELHLQQGLVAPRQHVSLLQDILRPCGLLPG